MDTVIIPRDARLNRHENALVISSESGQKNIPLKSVKHVICMGNGSITIPLLKDMGRRGIRFTLFDVYGGFLGSFEPVVKAPSGRVHIGQAELYLNESTRLKIARKLIQAQVKSMLAILKRYHRNGTFGLEQYMDELDRAQEIINKADSITSVLGIEGQARAFLHDSFKRISPNAKLEHRIRCPPPDPVNCLMSFLNMLLYATCANELAKTNLDKSISFLHSPGTNRPSLSLDMAEPFRPPLSDGLILSLFRRGHVNESWFDRQPNICLLNEKGRSKVTERFWSRIEQKSGNFTFREEIYRQCISLERESLGIGQFKSFNWRG